MKDILKTLALDFGGVGENIPKGSPETIRDNILAVVFWGLGVVGVIIIIYGGIQMMMSQGDAGKTQRARQTILYAVIGIIVVVAAAAITNFVLEAVG